MLDDGAIQEPKAGDVPTEVSAQNTDQEYYGKYRLETDLREPYRVPSFYLRDTRPYVSADLPECPSLVFINARSGGRVGPNLATVLARALGHAQVFDLSQFRPDKVLRTVWENYKLAVAHRDAKAPDIYKRMCIIAAGGDGTIAWILGCIKKLKLDPEPCVAVIPLGTGNDLSRSFGWGSAFNKAWIKNYHNVYNTLKRVADSEECDLDCWGVRVRVPDGAYFKELPYGLHKQDDDNTIAEGLFWNYMSIGMDAQSAFGFHSMREKHPWTAASRAQNQFWYGWFACTGGWFCGCAPNINAQLRKMEAQDKAGNWHEVKVPSSVKAIVILNLQSYAGGHDIWGKSLTRKERDKGWNVPTFNDGAFEVVGLQSGWDTGAVMGGAKHALRLAQSGALRMHITSMFEHGSGFAYLQLDGEPWKQPVPNADSQPLVLEVWSCGKSKMLYNKEPLSRMQLSPKELLSLHRRKAKLAAKGHKATPPTPQPPTAGTAEPAVNNGVGAAAATTHEQAQRRDVEMAHADAGLPPPIHQPMPHHAPGADEPVKNPEGAQEEQAPAHEIAHNAAQRDAAKL